MSTAALRYDRQVRLREVGAAGQARLESARARVQGCEGQGVELSYLERAGFRAVELAPRDPAAPFAHAELFRFEASRRVGAGAWRALEKIKRALGDGGA